MFPGVSGESIISKLKKAPELCSDLDDCQKTLIKDYLLQSSKLIKQMGNQFSILLKKLSNITCYQHFKFLDAYI